jgi:hypothetical protein
VTQRSFAWKENDGKILGVANTFNFSGLIVNGVDRYWLERGIAEAVIVHCAAAKLVCIDAFHVNYDPGDFYDLNHNSPAGAAKLGRYLGETLAKRPVCVRTERPGLGAATGHPGGRWKRKLTHRCFTLPLQPGQRPLAAAGGHSSACCQSRTGRTPAKARGNEVLSVQLGTRSQAGAAKPPSRWRSFLINAATVLASLAFTLLVLEASPS